MLQLRFVFLFIFLFLISIQLNAQDLLDLFDDDPETIEYVQSTFKSTRIINGQSIMNPPKGEMFFIISHRFGALNGGLYELFGIDQSSVRFGFEYGITDRIAISLGRSSYLKNYDGFIKYKLIRQSKGSKVIPFSLSWFSSISINSLKWEDPSLNNLFSSRLSYTHQFLLARKFSNKFSVQIMPSYIHNNLVETKLDQNDIFAIGAGGRFKITNRLSLNGEYFYLLPGKTADDYVNSLSVGVDIETGGHVFQLHLTNSLGMFENAFISQTNENWLDGGIHFGFNVVRVFSL
ncbi:MAG: hypothetical protein ISR55_12810 [Bacteroidetes bacterium]|nr:hypothetical protein [Bacteroidota bacterium]